MSDVNRLANSPAECDVISVNSVIDDSTEWSSSDATQNAVLQFWPSILDKMKKTVYDDMKKPQLPVARIKKVMKLDDSVRMISCESTYLLSKAAEFFIQELTLRSWTHTKKIQRCTLNQSDVAMAVSMYDQFDFLIDIVPREELLEKKKEIRELKFASGFRHFSLASPESAEKGQSLERNGVKVDDNADESDMNKNYSAKVSGKAPTKGAVKSISKKNITENTKNRMIKGPKSASSQRIALTTPAVQASPCHPGLLQILQQTVLPSGEIRYIPMQIAPQLSSFFFQPASDGSYHPVSFQNVIPANSVQLVPDDDVKKEDGVNQPAQFDENS